MAKKYIEIGVGVIWGRDRQNILIDRRLPDDSFGGYWEFPGGKVEAGENAIACIKREIQEEIGIEIEVGEHLITINNDYAEFSMALIVHHCYHLAGEPQLLECTEVRWIDVADLDQYQFPPANHEIITALRSDKW